MESVELTGRGASGLVRTSAERALARELPVRVKLGRRRPERKSRAPHLAEVVNLSAASAHPPKLIDYTRRAAKSLREVYGNDQWGDCVIAGKFHSAGVWSAEDQAKEIIGTTQEAVAEYHRICGPGDQGCYIDAVLDAMVKRGLKIGGKSRRIEGYCQVDWTRPELAKVALWVFGPLSIGFNIPQAWLDSDTWDRTDTPIVGGHDVSVVGYSDDYWYVASWGRIYRITPAAWNDQRYIEECYCLLSPDWYGPDKLTPFGVDAVKLAEALQRLERGEEPDAPPLPPPEPPAPSPKGPIKDLAFDTPGELTGGDDGVWHFRATGGAAQQAAPGAEMGAVTEALAGLPDVVSALAALIRHAREKAGPLVLASDVLALLTALGIDPRESRGVLGGKLPK